jgi:beta-galactosidase
MTPPSMTDQRPRRALGVCYYPEHWPESIWADDARRMIEAGLEWVRIGEFAWSRLEPEPDALDLDWLDRSIDVLGSAGLKVVLGTPTATPPRWMLTKHPDMLAVDAEGRQRGFGSRRHYCFSHQGYRAESRRITELLARRYGSNPHIAAWQTDNEYGCHDTTISYSNAARAAFRDWLGQRYQSVDALNRAWGNVFWSMDYRSFDEIDLPNLTVTEPSPAHAMAFRRFASDMVRDFNVEQVRIIRRFSDAPIAHNYMGRVTDFDHFDVGNDLDIASWDSYPLGFLEDRVGDDAAHQRAYARQGDPDFQAFHHDLYRAVGRGRWWVMEQQPGPVNWAPVNPAPLPGMCKLWALEAFAHGAETVCFFRWRQAPFAQEQMHAGLLRPDSADAPAMAEIAEVIAALKGLPEGGPEDAPVALIFDYSSEWAWQVQPQGMAFSYFRLVFETYRAVRKLGLDVDILPLGAKPREHRVVLAPGVFHASPEQVAMLTDSGAVCLFGPRFNSKTEEFTIPVPLPPAVPGISCTVTHVETFRADLPRPVAGGGAVRHWLEAIESDEGVLEQTEDGAPVLVGEGTISYLAGWPDEAAFDRILRILCARAGIDTVSLPEGVRIRRIAGQQAVFNYSAEHRMFEGRTLPPASVLWPGKA